MRGDYSKYLRSAHWRGIKARYRKSDRKQACEVCDSTPFELHHKTYERLGAERLEDLVALCQNCHSVLHQLQREGQATLDPDSLFSTQRAEQYRRAKPPPVVKEAVRRLTSLERQQLNERMRHLSKIRKKAHTGKLSPEMVRKYGGYLAKRSAKQGRA